MFVGEITNVYLDRGRRTINKNKTTLPRAGETHAQAMGCAFAPELTLGQPRGLSKWEEHGTMQAWGVVELRLGTPHESW